MPDEIPKPDFTSEPASSESLFGWKRLLTSTPLLLTVMSLLGACTSPEPPSSPLEIPTAFGDSGEAPLHAQWWTEFGDPELNQRIDRALQNNFNLQATWESIEEAKAILRSRASQLYPSIDASLSAREQDPESTNSSAREFGVAASYELDLWGRIRSSISAEDYRFQATQFDYQSAAISLAAEVATVYFQLVEAQIQADLVGQQLRINESVLEALEARYGGGLVRSSDLLRQENLIESSREQLITVETRIEILRIALAVLEGKAPNDTEPSSASKLPELPNLPQTGLPVELVQRRPDVSASWAIVQASNADLATALRDRYPSLFFSASSVSEGEEIGDLLDTWIHTIIGEFVGPIFRGGQLKAEVKRSEAVVRRQTMFYGQTVLLALQEVENALLRERQQTRVISSKQRQVELANRTYNRLQSEYSNGVSEYIDMLTALIDQQGLQRELVEAKRILLEYRVGLYRALAGDPVSEKWSPDDER